MCVFSDYCNGDRLRWNADVDGKRMGCVNERDDGTGIRKG